MLETQKFRDRECAYYSDPWERGLKGEEVWNTIDKPIIGECEESCENVHMRCLLVGVAYDWGTASWPARI